MLEVEDRRHLVGASVVPIASRTDEGPDYYLDRWQVTPVGSFFCAAGDFFNG